MQDKDHSRLLRHSSSSMTSDDDISIISNKSVLSLQRKKNSSSQLTTEKGLATLIADMIAIDLLPLSFAENRGFRQLMEAIFPDYIVPGRKAITGVIRKKYNITVEKLNRIIQSSTVAITIDAWSSQTMTSFVTVTIHFFNDNWEIEFYVLQTREFEERHTAANLKIFLEQVSKNWRLDGKIVATVHDNASNIKLAARTSIIIGESICCFAHTLQCAINSALNNEEIQIMLKKASLIVSHFKHSALAIKALLNEQKQLQLPEHRLIQSCSTRWNSTYYMLDRLVEQKEAIVNVITNSIKSRTNDNLLLLEKEWDEVKQIVKILTPFEKVTTVLSSQKFTSLSMVRPAIRSILKKFLEVANDDTNMICNLKENLREELNRRFLKNVVAQDVQCSASLVATFLDPRYKDMAEEEENVKLAVVEFVRNEMKILISTDSTPELKQSSRCSDLEYIFQGNYRVKKRASVNDYESELEDYLKEQTIALTINECQWWKGNSSIYPTLAQLAKKYLCIPATSTPAESFLNGWKYCDIEKKLFRLR